MDQTEQNTYFLLNYQMAFISQWEELLFSAKLQVLQLRQIMYGFSSLQKSKMESKKNHCQKLDQQSFHVSYVLDVNNSCRQINDFYERLWFFLTAKMLTCRQAQWDASHTVVPALPVSQTSSQTHTEDEKVTQW